MVWTHGGNDRLAKSLNVLLNQIVAKFPNRDTENDGTIGDATHQMRKSDHNPTVHDAQGNGVVRALDITHDPQHGFDAGAFAEALRLSQDPRISYVIFNGRIFNSQVEPWVWRPRNKGPGDHAQHVHVSVQEDEALYDSDDAWAAVDQTAPATSGKAPGFPPKVRKGSSGPAVFELQRLLGLQVTGFYDDETDRAVRAFQRDRDLEDDGIVGTLTWGLLLAGANPANEAVTAVHPIALVNRLMALAAQSKVVKINWKDRGAAPLGYIQGMAVAFGGIYAKWKSGDSAARIMASTELGAEASDALAYYAPMLRTTLGTSTSDADTLRQLFVLLFGLGMRESSGRYFCGRDVTAKNVAADTAEAGLFQMSWNMKNTSSEMARLFDYYSAHQAEGLLNIFSQGLVPNQSNLENFGSGEGFHYQKLAKSCPAFAVETAALGLRLRRKHWGPVNRQEVEIRPEVDELLKFVQAEVETALVAKVEQTPSTVDKKATEVESTSGHRDTPVDLLQLLVLLMTTLQGGGKMSETSDFKTNDPLKILLPLLLQSALSGENAKPGDLLAQLLGTNTSPISSVPMSGAVGPSVPSGHVTGQATAVNDMLPMLVGLLLPLLYERISGRPWPKDLPTDTPTEPAATPSILNKPSVQLGAGGLAVTSILQALGYIGMPFGIGPDATPNGTLATLVPLAVGLLGPTGIFGSLLKGARILLGGLGRVLGAAKG